MKTFKISNKISWRNNLVENSEKAFYPSFYKNLVKREEFFKKEFSYDFVDATQYLLKNVFFPLYEKEIMAREEYTLDRIKIRAELEKKISASKDYKFLFIKQNEELAYALLFIIKNEGLYFGYRAFNRNVQKNLLRGATVSYWAEKLVFEFGNNKKIKFFSRGVDSHPFLGEKRLGLPMYKLKTGVKPRVPVDSNIQRDLFLNESDILKKNTPILFFSNENKEGFYGTCNLYYPKGSLNESFVNEIKKISQWADIEFLSVEYNS